MWQYLKELPPFLVFSSICILLLMGCKININCDGDIDIDSEKKVKSIDQCVYYNGNLTISKSYTDADARPLKLEHLDGDIRVYDVDMEPAIFVLFDNLKEMRGNIVFRWCRKLGSLEAFPSLERIEGGIHIWQSRHLKGIGGFDALEEVSKKITIEENHALKKISGFGRLREVGDSIEVVSNQWLEEIDAFGNLAIVKDDIKIDGNWRLKTVGKLGDNLVFNGGLVFGESELTDFSFVDLNENTGSIVISDNESIVELKDFDSLKKVRGVLITNCDNLKRIDAYNKLEEARGRVIIQLNDRLEEIGGFEKLKRVGSISISQNKRLNSISFESLEEIDDQLKLFRNERMEKINTFKKLKKIGQGLLINQDRLKRIMGLGKNLRVEGSILVYGLELEDISGLLKEENTYDVAELTVGGSIDRKQLEAIYEIAKESNPSLGKPAIGQHKLVAYDTERMWK